MPDAELFQLMTALNNTPRIQRLRSDDLAVLTQIAGAAKLIQRLLSFDATAATLQMVVEKYSELRTEFRREVVNAGAGGRGLPPELMLSLMPLVRELQDASGHIRSDASDCYTAAEGLFADLNECLHGAFGDLGFPKMRLERFVLGNPPGL